MKEHQPSVGDYALGNGQSGSYVFRFSAASDYVAPEVGFAEITIDLYQPVSR